jgi:hypothetical protein
MADFLELSAVVACTSYTASVCVDPPDVAARWPLLKVGSRDDGAALQQGLIG